MAQLRFLARAMLLVLISMILQGCFQDAAEKSQSLRQKAEAKANEFKVKSSEHFADAKEKASELKLHAKEKAFQLKDKASEHLDNAKEQASELKEKASEHLDDAREQASELKDHAQEKASELKDKASEHLDDAKEQASELKEKASEHLEDAKEQASELKDLASEHVTDLLKSHKMENLKEHAKELDIEQKDKISLANHVWELPKDSQHFPGLVSVAFSGAAAIGLSFTAFKVYRRVNMQAGLPEELESEDPALE